MKTPKKILILVMDFLLLAELTFSMYWSAPHGKAMAAVFLRTYIPMASATVVAIWLLLRRFQKSAPSASGEPSP